MAIRILLADDHGIMRAGLRAILALEDDLEVVGEANDGRALLTLARLARPDVVVMDVGMPELNGIEATRRLRELQPATRVLALSTHSDRQYVLAMLEAGAGGYVVKEAAAEELVRAIRAVERGQTYLCAEVAGGVVAHAITPTAAPNPATELLTEREREVLQLVAEGHTTQQIAGRLHIAVKTVEAHRRNIMKALGLHSVADLTRFAVRHGLTEP
jgi:two-component system NarL family response regulator